jgi:N-acetylneuraminic acid mutarotase
VTKVWTRLPGAPISTRENPTIVWTGHELIVWGGLTANQNGRPDRYEGAVYDPGINSWHALPSSGLPSSGLPPIELAAAAWTGHEMIVFGSAAAGGSGPDVGAAYDPTTNHWRPIATTPLTRREQMSSTWTGHELIVWGGISFSGVRHTLADGAAYDPTSNTWRALAKSPLGSRWGAGMTTTADGLVIVVGGNGPSTAATAGNSEPPARGAAAYRP